MAWQVEIERKAQKALKKIPNPFKSNIIEAIDRLTEDVRPVGSKKLRGAEDLYRIRVNDYRIVYQIHDQKLVVLIVRIGHRKDIYEGL
ncbi:type II toxin-antitoxin system RelE family toxin [Rhodohalobacter sp. 614A]|uniref:type II toxin-antitoxin system RelE family toxin n=1 Tax=Rhodohalobacter sp. 614A TaxID=2908649 RepID=UPI001F2AB39D|nr:type II toxin-antitoxin system RelE/ParE family toxin [Rhodohalobacter sp. 614A]